MDFWSGFRGRNDSLCKSIGNHRYTRRTTMPNAANADPCQPAAAPRLLYVVSEDWYFLSHRLPMARAARDAGFEVHVATSVRDGAAAIAAEGFILHPIPFARRRLSPLASLATISALRRIHRRRARVTIACRCSRPCSAWSPRSAWRRPSTPSPGSVTPSLRRRKASAVKRHQRVCAPLIDRGGLSISYKTAMTARR